VNHPVAVGAEQRKVCESRSLTWPKRMYWLSVVTFDKAASTLAIPILKTEAADLAEAPAIMLCLKQCFAPLDQSAVPLARSVYARQESPLGCFHLFTLEITDGTCRRIADGGTNSLCRTSAFIGFVREFSPNFLLLAASSLQPNSLVLGVESPQVH